MQFISAEEWLFVMQCCPLVAVKCVCFFLCFYILLYFNKQFNLAQ